MYMVLLAKPGETWCKPTFQSLCKRLVLIS